jgi:plasmid maintenance system antidote protein VapI
MRTTIEFLDALKAKLGVTSDYALAAKLGITRAAVSGYRTGRDYFGDEMAVTVGELLGINPAFVMTCAHAERAKAGKVKNYWIAAAERMAAAVFLAVCIGLFIQPQQAVAQGFSTADNIQTDCTLYAIEYTSSRPARVDQSTICRWRSGKSRMSFPCEQLLRFVTCRGFVRPAGRGLFIPIFLWP